MNEKEATNTEEEAVSAREIISPPSKKANPMPRTLEITLRFTVEYDGPIVAWDETSHSVVTSHRADFHTENEVAGDLRELLLHQADWFGDGDDDYAVITDVDIAEILGS